eukprot:357591-Chlamydomonas_euryale.AAC.5
MKASVGIGRCHAVPPRLKKPHAHRSIASPDISCTAHATHTHACGYVRAAVAGACVRQFVTRDRTKGGCQAVCSACGTRVRSVRMRYTSHSSTHPVCSQSKARAVQSWSVTHAPRTVHAYFQAVRGMQHKSFTARGLAQQPSRTCANRYDFHRACQQYIWHAYARIRVCTHARTHACSPTSQLPDNVIGLAD